MEVEIAFDTDETRKLSWQDEFPIKTKCCHCKGEARLGFVAHEKYKKGGRYICQIHKNKPEKKELWLHDLCCVAIYFCKECLGPTALYNQA